MQCAAQENRYIVMLVFCVKCIVREGELLDVCCRINIDQEDGMN